MLHCQAQVTYMVNSFATSENADLLLILDTQLPLAHCHTVFLPVLALVYFGESTSFDDGKAENCTQSVLLMEDGFNV